MKKNKITFGFIILIVLIGILIVVTKIDRNKPFSGKESIPMADTKAIIHTKFGDITLSFFSRDAPKHVDNFIELAKKDFFNQGKALGEKLIELYPEAAGAYYWYLVNLGSWFGGAR